MSLMAAFASVIGICSFLQNPIAAVVDVVGQSVPAF